MPRRRKDRIDTNEGEIVKVLRDRGYSVVTGMDDIVVGHNGRTYWYEIKTGPRAEIKPGQLELLDTFKGHYAIVWTAQMIINEVENAKH